MEKASSNLLSFDLGEKNTGDRDISFVKKDEKCAEGGERTDRAHITHK